MPVEFEQDQEEEEGGENSPVDVEINFDPPIEDFEQDVRHTA